MSWQFTSLSGLVKRSIKSGEEENHDLSAHAQEQHDIGPRQVG